MHYIKNVEIFYYCWYEKRKKKETFWNRLNLFFRICWHYQERKKIYRIHKYFLVRVGAFSFSWLFLVQVVYFSKLHPYKWNNFDILLALGISPNAPCTLPFNHISLYIFSIYWHNSTSEQLAHSCTNIHFLLYKFYHSTKSFVGLYFVSWKTKKLSFLSVENLFFLIFPLSKKKLSMFLHSIANR